MNMWLKVTEKANGSREGCRDGDVGILTGEES